MIKCIGNTIARKHNNGLYLYVPKNTIDNCLYGMEINTNVRNKAISILMRINIYCYSDHLLCTMKDNRISRVITKIPDHSHINNDIKLTINPGENKIGFISRLRNHNDKNIELLVIKDFNFISRKYTPDEITGDNTELFKLNNHQKFQPLYR